MPQRKGPAPYVVLYSGDGEHWHHLAYASTLTAAEGLITLSRNSASQMRALIGEPKHSVQWRIWFANWSDVTPPQFGGPSQ